MISLRSPALTLILVPSLTSGVASSLVAAGPAAAQPAPKAAAAQPSSSAAKSLANRARRIALTRVQSSSFSRA